MSFKCKECGTEFGALKSLHAHIKKHDMFLGDYYVKNFARKDKLSGKLLQFKNYEDYFDKDFSSYNQLLKWCDSAPQEEVKQYLIDCLKSRIDRKGFKSAPNTVELFTSDMPPMSVYKRLHGSYSVAADLAGSKPMFSAGLPLKFYEDYSNTKIFIDTREQQPLKFKNSESLKLDIGDYAVGGDDYNYTYVDRKSFGDFCGTMSQASERFARELQRCRSVGGFLFIVTETNLYNMEKLNVFSPKKYKLNYVFHNMRELQREFSDCCQFVFSGNRTNSQILIPKLLVCGQSLWNTDIQYFLDSGALED